MTRSLRRWAQSFAHPSPPTAASLAAGLGDLALTEDDILPKAARDLKTTPIEMSPEGEYEPVSSHLTLKPAGLGDLCRPSARCDGFICNGSCTARRQ